MERVLLQETRPCKDCKHSFKDMRGMACGKKLMSVFAEMKVGYISTDGTCFEARVKVGDTVRCVKPVSKYMGLNETFEVLSINENANVTLIHIGITYGGEVKNPKWFNSNRFEIV